MIGILTEKPSAKRNFSKALGGDKGKFNGEDYIIVNALGHLYTLKDPELQVPEEVSAKYKSWKIENLPWNHKEFKWEYSTSKGAPEILKEIKTVLSKCDEICIATDIDPTGEGDLLAGEIIFELKLNKKNLTRMEFVDESPKSLQKAFVNRRKIVDFEKDLNYQKALFRSKWDFLSMQFTRVATGLAPGRAVIRQGRLKSTMVYLTGEALEKAEGYEKIPFFQNRFIDENKVVYTNPKEKEYDKKEDVPNTYKPSKVVLDKKTMKKTPPPKLIDLAKLSSMLAPRGYDSKEVLATYQKMYQDGYLSYPRTADKNITHEQFKEMLPIADQIAKVMGLDAKLLVHKKPRPTHVKDEGSHGANRPGLKVPKSLEDLKKYGRAALPIYTTLARNYLAMLCADYEYENQTGHIEDYPAFKGSTNVPKFLGWKEIFNFEEEEEETTAGLGTLGKPFVFEGYPPKPPTPTMSWLMKQLEKYNVGNGSTRTSTFSEVTSTTAKYPLMISEKGKLSLTPYGKVSHSLLKGTKIGDVKTTESVLDAMDKIGAGETKLIEEKLKEIAELLAHDIGVMRENAKGLEGIPYEKKEYKQVEKETFTSKSGKEISFKKEWGGHTFTEEEIELLTQGKEITIKGLKNKRGKLYSATGKLKQQDFKGKKFWGFKMEVYQENGKDPVKFD
jgi:DNA topoisomerase-3